MKVWIVKSNKNHPEETYIISVHASEKGAKNKQKELEDKFHWFVIVKGYEVNE